MTDVARTATLAELHAEVDTLLADVPDGAPLSPLVRALVQYAVCSSVVVLDAAGAQAAAERALEHGASAAQLQQVLTLVSGLGVHTLMEGSRQLATLVEGRGGALPEVDAARAALRERLLGSTPFWDRFEGYVPGFLDALLRLSPEAFEAFVAYAAVPARLPHLPPVAGELCSVAVDALPQHRYLPGLRLHLAGALHSGAGRAEINEAVAIAAAAPEPPGVG